jgi:hypothetical protein
VYLDKRPDPSEPTELETKSLNENYVYSKAVPTFDNL